MATKEEVMGDLMRMVYRSFADLLEGDQFAYTLRGLILGFDPTCARAVRDRIRHPVLERLVPQDGDVPRLLCRSR
jgi:hypothetical protein